MVVGVIVDPAGPVSVTVAVHIVDWLTMRVESTHVRTVTVGRPLAVMSHVPAVLYEKAPPVGRTAVIVCVPVAEGV